VKKMGLAGVFIGTLISNLSVVFWVKPKIVFNQVFNKSFFEYLSHYLKYLAFAFVPFLLTRGMYNIVNFNNGVLSFLMNCIANVLIINLTYVVMFYKNNEFLYYKNLIIKRIKRN